MRRYLPHIGIVVGIAIAVYALFFGKSEADRIRAKLDALEEAVSVAEGETNVVLRAAQLRKAFAEIFARDVTVAIPELSEPAAGRDDLVALGASAPQHYRTASVDLGGLSIKLDEPETSAVAYGDAMLTGTLHSGELERDGRTVSLRFDKIDGDWLIGDISVSAQRQGP